MSSWLESSDLQPDPVPDSTSGLRMSILSATPMAEDARPSQQGAYDHIQCIINGLPEDLTAEQRARAEAFIKARSNVFSHSEYNIGRTSIIPPRIDTGNTAPNFEQLRCHPTTQLPLIDEQVENMLRHDVIEPAAWSWCSNVMMVHKQDGIT